MMGVAWITMMERVIVLDYFLTVCLLFLHANLSIICGFDIAGNYVVDPRANYVYFAKHHTPYHCKSDSGMG